MRLLLKSKIYQIEIQRWLLTTTLVVWSMTSTVFALQNRKEIVLIGVESNGFARVITDRNDRILQNELKAFTYEFLNNYYSYDESSFLIKLSKSTDMMSEKLFESEKTKIFEISENLKKTPLSQSFEIESLDLINGNQVEAILKLKVQQRLAEKVFRLKINLEIESKPRTAVNPWGFEIREVTDVVL